MEENNFKEGDIVVCIDNNGISKNLTLGALYVIANLERKDLVKVLDDRCLITSFRTNRFKLATNFKVGDKVVCIDLKDPDVIRKKIQKDKVYIVDAIDDEPENVFATFTDIGGRKYFRWFNTRTFAKVLTNTDLIEAQFKPYVK